MQAAAAPGPSSIASATESDDLTFSSAEPDATSHGFPAWLLPAVLLLLTSTVAVIGAVVSPRLRGEAEQHI